MQHKTERSKQSQSASPRRLILAAVNEELEELLPLESDHHCLGVRAVGIGLVEAGINTTRILTELIAKGETPEVIWVGSAGLLNQKLESPSTAQTYRECGVEESDPKAPELLNLALISKVSLLDHASLLGLASISPISERSIEANAELKTRSLSLARQGLPGIHSLEAFSALGICRSDELALMMLQRGIFGVETMELYAVARAAVMLSVPWGAVCCITNYLGASSQEEWNKNRTMAANLTAGYVKGLFNLHE